MAGAFDTDSAHSTIHQRVRASFTSSYLTLLGITQGVALAELAGVIDAGYQRFTIIHWLMAAVTFFLLIVVWDHLSTDAMTFVWIPDFRDSALPLLIGAIELFLCHAVGLGLNVWLYGVSATAVIACLYIWYVRWQAERDAENSAARRYIRTRWSVHRACNIAGVIVFPSLAIAGIQGLFGTADRIEGTPSLMAGCAILLVAFWLFGYIFGTYRAWAMAVEEVESRTSGRRRLGASMRKRSPAARHEKERAESL